MKKASSNQVLQGLFENDLDMSILTHILVAGDATGSKASNPKLMEIDDLGITSNDIAHNEDYLSEEEGGVETLDKRDSSKAKSQSKRRTSTIDRRRERNRVLARKTRLRKKYFFEVSFEAFSSLLTSPTTFKYVTLTIPSIFAVLYLKFALLSQSLQIQVNQLAEENKHLKDLFKYSRMIFIPIT